MNDIFEIKTDYAFFRNKTVIFRRKLKYLLIQNKLERYQIRARLFTTCPILIHFLTPRLRTLKPGFSPKDRGLTSPQGIVYGRSLGLMEIIFTLKQVVHISELLALCLRRGQLCVGK